jgi:hypothetical protein
VDYLVATASTSKRSGGDPLKMELAEAVEACRKEGVLSQKVADLSSVVRGYRNLIHPGRMIRLGEKIDSKTGRIAKSLVDVVIDEVAAGRQEKCGFTAEQIANKLGKDSSALSVLSHFLKDSSEYERERLLTDVIPERYFANRGEEWDTMQGQYLQDLESCFRQTFNTLSDDKKAVVTKRFIKVLREADQDTVFEHETAFFRGSDLKYLSPNEAQFAKEHLLSRLQEKQTVRLMKVLDGIGEFLTPNELAEVTDALVKAAIYGKVEPLKRVGRDSLYRLWGEIEISKNEPLFKRLDVWISFFGDKGMSEEEATVKKIRSEMDIPF